MADTQVHKSRSALISGASIAGPTLAYWLDRYGFDVTVVERAPAVRSGGYPIDIRGTAIAVIERMRLLPQVKAAHIAEVVLSKPDDAVKHLRAAWVACPGDSEVLDHLARLLAPSPSEALDGEVRGLAELYAQAAQKTSDGVRRVAYLEKVALLWEDLLGDTRRAVRCKHGLLFLPGTRTGALVMAA